MDAKENLQGLLSAVGAKLGIPGLALDDAGACSLVFDGRTTINLQADSLAGNLILFAELGALRAADTNIYASLLEANLFWKGTGGGTLAVEPQSRAVLLQYQDSLVGMDQVRFEQILERFISAAEQWTSRLAEMVKDAAENGGEAQVSEGASGIRV